MRKGAWLVVFCHAAFAGAPVITELQPRGAERGPLFSPVTKAGRTVPRRLTDQVVLRVLAEARARSRRRRVLRARPA